MEKQHWPVPVRSRCTISVRSTYTAILCAETGRSYHCRQLVEQAPRSAFYKLTHLREPSLHLPRPSRINMSDAGDNLSILHKDDISCWKRAFRLLKYEGRSRLIAYQSRCIEILMAIGRILNITIRSYVSNDVNCSVVIFLGGFLSSLSRSASARRDRKCPIVASWHSMCWIIVIYDSVVASI